MALSRLSQSEASPYDEELLERAILSLKSFLDDFPQSPYREEAEKHLSELLEKKAEKLYKIAEFYEKNLSFSSAVLYYQEICEKFPQTSWGRKAEEKLEWLKKFGFY